MFSISSSRETETGPIIVTPFPGVIETKPGSATVPFFGIKPAILDPVSGKVLFNYNTDKVSQELEGNNIKGVLVMKQPCPSIAHSVFNDHNCYLEMYMKLYAKWEMVPHTMNMAIFGSRAVLLMVKTSSGRCPACNDYFVDVINVSGHCLSTAEIKSALIMHKSVAKTAVISTADELTVRRVQLLH
jgi:acetyl-CoA synthetase